MLALSPDLLFALFGLWAGTQSIGHEGEGMQASAIEEQVPGSKAIITTKFVEVSSGTDEKSFDWVTSPWVASPMQIEGNEGRDKAERGQQNKETQTF